MNIVMKHYNYGIAKTFHYKIAYDFMNEDINCRFKQSESYTIHNLNCTLHSVSTSKLIIITGTHLLSYSKADNILAEAHSKLIQL